MYEEPIAAYFSDFAVSATVGLATVQVIFDRPYRAVNPETGVVESTAPVATLTSADVETLPIDHGTEVEIGTETYQVVGIEPDGQGLTRLILELQ